MAVRVVATAGHGMRGTNGRLAPSVMNIGFGPRLPSARQASEQVTDVWSSHSQLKGKLVRKVSAGLNCIEFWIAYWMPTVSMR